MRNLDLRNWYWQAADGRVFSSARQVVIAGNDSAYDAWLAAGNVATPWPADGAGAQTDAALQWVFDNSGVPVFVTLAAYAANARYAKETGGLVLNGSPVLTDRESQTMVSNAYAYVTASGADSVSYKTPDGFITLDAATLKVIALAVGAHVQACFAAEGTVDAGITDGSITTIAQIDAAFAAI